MKHNNKISNGHFKKHWQSLVKTWFDQPAKKRRRRQKRIEKKINSLNSIPTKNIIRPIIHCPNNMYNMKVRFGKGFSIEEISKANISKKQSASLGISIDKRKKNKNIMENFNIERLKNFKNKIIFLKTRKQLLNDKNIQIHSFSKEKVQKKIKFRKFKFY